MSENVHSDDQKQPLPPEPGEQKPSQPATIYLIRHGTNDWVGSHRLAGWTPGVHLNEQGKRQALALAGRLAKEKLAAIYSSPLERTLETAEPLARAHDLAIRIRDGLGEVKYGDWTGRSIKDLAENEADLWRVIQVSPSLARFPNGEGLYEMQARAVQEIDAIARTHAGEVVAIISHADVIKACLAHYLGVHLDLFQRIIVNPASLSVVHLSPLGVMIASVNDTSHVPEEHPLPVPGAAEQKA